MNKRKKITPTSIEIKCNGHNPYTDVKHILQQLFSFTTKYK